MSRRFKPNVVDSDEEDDMGEENGVFEKREQGNNKGNKARFLLGGCDYKKGIKRAKMVIAPIRRLPKLFKGQTTRSSSSTTTSKNLSSANNSSRIGNYYCCMCLSKPQTLDTNSDEFDPSDPNVSYDCIKSLIEKNDFYSNECNTHFGE